MAAFEADNNLAVNGDRDAILKVHPAKLRRVELKEQNRGTQEPTFFLIGGGGVCSNDEEE